MRLLRLGLAAGLLLGCGPGGAVQRKQTRLMMDTYVAITVRAERAKADRALAAAFDRLEGIGRKFDHLDTASPLYAFNVRNEPLADPEVVAVVTAAQGLSELSDGVFDVTVEPLVRLWGFYGDSQAVPLQRQIDSCRRPVGYRNLALEPGRVTKRNPQTTIDLGGIAKGYALVEAARVLAAAGVESALVDAGGDVYAIGRKAGAGWRIGVRNPRGEGVVGVLEVSDKAVVTSGDYERFFFGPDSVRYCHIIDPRTGRPARGLASATVVMPDPLAAQAWSKVLFILGPAALPMAESAGIEALVVTEDGRLIGTAGMGLV
ncbi:FAD:protein FMN transferase, partial [candidate division WOR-3 bacterium]|nr:FAD:protein FMN transferase [candidate division WOR-3 bacterium]